MARVPDPTPEEIAAACRAIRATWSDDTRRARRCAEDRPVEVPIVAVGELSRQRDVSEG